MQKELDLKTFGGGLVHVILAEELNRLNDPKQTRVVGKTLSQLKSNLNAINKNLEKKQKLFFYKLVKDYTLKSINDSKILKDQTVINFLKNAVIRTCREYFRTNKLN